MILRDAWTSEPLAASHSRLGWATWVSLLLALAFSGICAMARTNGDQIVAWLLSQGVVGESETSTLHGMVTNGAAAAGIAGLVAAPLIVLWGVFGLYPWTPVQAIAGYLWQALRPMASPIHHAVYAALQNTGLLAASLFRPVASAASVIIRSVGMSGAATFVYAAKVLTISLGCVQAGLSASIGYSANVVALALRKGWAVISIPLAHAEHGLLFVLVRPGGMVKAAARYSQHAVYALILTIELLVYIFVKVAVLALGWTIEVLGYQRGVASAIALFVKSVGRHLGRGLPAILEFVVRVLRRYARVAVWAPLSWAWRSLAFFLRNVRLGAATVLGDLERALMVVFPLAWMVAFTTARLSWRTVSAVVHHIWLGAKTGFRYLGRPMKMALGYIGMAVWAILSLAWWSLAFILRNVRLGAATVLGHLGRALMVVFALAWMVAFTTARPVQQGVSAAAKGTVLAMSLAGHGVALGLGSLWMAIFTVAQALGSMGSTAVAGTGSGARLAGLGLATALSPIWLGITAVAGYMRLVVTTLMGYLHGAGFLAGQAVGILSLAYGAGFLLKGLFWPVFLVARQLWLGASTASLLLGWLARCAWVGGLEVLRAFKKVPLFVGWMIWTGIGAVPDVVRTASWLARHKKGVLTMSDYNLTRQRVLSLIATLWVLSIVGSLVGWSLWPAPPEPTVEVEHWSTGHLMREGENIRLLPVMAEQFNRAGHRTNSGTRIVIKVHNVPSELIAEYLIPRVNNGRGIDLTEISGGYVKPGYSDPTIVTPSSAHWLVTVNHEVRRTLVDLSSAQSIVRPVIGIVTYEEMARCLGWPEKELGYADILALRADPAGWTKYPCASPQWGRQPLVAYTDPTTSSTGRSLLLGLYSIAAGVKPGELRLEDVNNQKVVDYVKEFQGLIDHYLIGTTVLNTKIHQGPRYGQFFIMPEDNLIHLYEGTERAFINGVKVRPPPIAPGSMVMIYPKEGAMPRNNCACIIQADWVSPEQVEAAQQWIDFLMGDQQQRNFMAAGFRPGGDISLNDPSSKISARYGLDPAKPTVTLNPSLIDPAVAAEIDKNWQLVKRPGIVTFVVDTSGSMMGTKINQAREGLVLALENMAKNNQVGLVGFSETIHTRIRVGPLMENGFEIADAAKDMRARGETALYDAIKAGIEMTDEAEGPADAIRAVVVLTDGRANRGQVKLDDLIRMSSRDERPVQRFGGFVNDAWAVAADGGRIEKADLIGDDLAMANRHPIQVFFIGIGDDADLDVGRMLAEATGAEFQGVTEKDLASVLEEFSKYF